MKTTLDRVELGLVLIRAINETLLEGEKITELQVYKENKDGTEDLYVKVEDYSPYTNEKYMTHSLLNALKSNSTLTLKQNTELSCFRSTRVITI